MLSSADVRAQHPAHPGGAARHDPRPHGLRIHVHRSRVHRCSGQLLDQPGRPGRGRARPYSGRGLSQTDGTPRSATPARVRFGAPKRGETWPTPAAAASSLAVTSLSAPPMTPATATGRRASAMTSMSSSRRSFVAVQGDDASRPRPRPAHDDAPFSQLVVSRTRAAAGPTPT